MLGRGNKRVNSVQKKASSNLVTSFLCTEPYPGHEAVIKELGIVLFQRNLKVGHKMAMASVLGLAPSTAARSAVMASSLSCSSFYGSRAPFLKLQCKVQLGQCRNRQGLGCRAALAVDRAHRRENNAEWMFDPLELGNAAVPNVWEAIEAAVMQSRSGSGRAGSSAKGAAGALLHPCPQGHLFRLYMIL